MRQLKLDIKDENIIQQYWQSSNDIPKKIKKYLENYCHNFILEDMDTQIFYCSSCLYKLNESKVCEQCHKKYNFKNQSNIYKVNINDLKRQELNCTHLVFDTPDNEVILYVIDTHVSYDNSLSSKPIRNISFKIENAYHILKDRCQNLYTKKVYLYKDITENIINEKYIFCDDIDISLDEYTYNKYLYPDNLDNLKNTIYCYTRIWQAKKYLKNKHICISNLVYIPLYYPGFEYLIKYKLYSLAFDNPHLIKYDKETKKILNPKSEYLEFIIKNNLDYWHFEALKLCKIKNIKLINFMHETVEIYEYLLKFPKIKILELYNYLKTNNYDIIEYYDYIRFSKLLGYDLTNKEIIYPHNLKEAHQKIIEQKDIVYDKKYDEKIKKLTKILEKNKYEDNEYIIYPAPSVKELINEGKNQNNCLRFYIEDYSNNKTQIYFMRKKENLKKSFITIEIKNRKLIQARLKNNEIPNKNILNILNTWASKL